MLRLKAGLRNYLLLRRFRLKDYQLEVHLVKLSLLDWSVIAAYFLFNLGIGIYYARRARGSTTDFFLSGRDVPW